MADDPTTPPIEPIDPDADDARQEEESGGHGPTLPGKPKGNGG